MNVHLAPSTFSLDAFLAEQERRDLLRFITCGSVDDGKSTLIGRLLYESKRLYEDQVTTLERESKKIGTQGGALDFALLLDGLAAEREQGITIDVAYRFFSTERRSFIVADTPGHEQYTRNMATGASTADLAILLVDARKGLSRQTRRHSLLVSMLGIRNVVIAINKMDLVGWSRDTYEAIMAEYRAFAVSLGFKNIAGIPLSALHGDNVVAASDKTPWYSGPTLLGHLEEVETETGVTETSFRLPVQWVNRPNAGFRGFAGLVASGSVRPGMRVRILPAGTETKVARIVTFDGDLPQAIAGQAVTLTFADEVDASRGDIIVAADDTPYVSDRIDTRLFWMAQKPLRPGDVFHLKIGTLTVAATIGAVHDRVDLETLDSASAQALDVNDIGRVTLVLDRPIPFDAYARSRDTGSFILIDRESYDTVGMGLVEGPAEAAPARVTIAQRLSKLTGRLRGSHERPWRSLVKAFTWRVTGTFDTMIIAYIFTQDARVSAAIGLTEVATKLVLYYGHERIWARISFGLKGKAKTAGAP
jgi:sulfate adenylyltransferase large subunit